MLPFLLFASLVDLIWQVLYWKVGLVTCLRSKWLILLTVQFVFVDRRKKIESGQRTTSLSFLLNDKRGVIGRSLSRVPPQYRTLAFMFGQYGE